MTVSTRSLVKLEAIATAFRTVVTAAAGLLALAIFTGVASEDAIASAVLLSLIAIGGPIVHGALAIVLRDERDWALEATLAATGVLFALDLVTTLTVHLQDVLANETWSYVLTMVLVAIVHVVVLVQAGRAFVEQRARQATEPEPEGEPEAS